MRVLACGDRRWSDMVTIRRRLADLAEAELPELLIHGDAMGADRMAGYAAELLGIPTQPVPAEWQRYGKRAGHIRNQQMLDMAPDLVLAFHDNLLASKGTRDMVRRARTAGILVRIYQSTDGTPMATWKGNG